MSASNGINPQEAGAHPLHADGYLPPSAPQSGYYHHDFHRHPPPYQGSNLTAHVFNPAFQPPLASHSLGLAQHGYPAVVDQSDQQANHYLPPHPYHPTHQPNLRAPHAQEIGRDVANGNEPTASEVQTAIQGGKRQGKRPAVQQPKKTAPKKAKKATENRDETGDSSTQQNQRGAKACLSCRSLKIRCVGAVQGSSDCGHCQMKGLVCVFDTANSTQKLIKKREIFSRQLKRMEGDLSTLENVRNCPGFVPIPQEASSSAASNHTQPPADSPLAGAPTPAPLSSPSSVKQSFEFTSQARIKRNPMSTSLLRRPHAERQVQPEMLSFISAGEVAELFDIYFNHLNVQSGLLDRDFHTPSMVCARSPFLLTTICAISAKFYRNPDYYPRLAPMAKKLAFHVLERGYKSVEIVQAYILLAMWSPGSVERYEQDRAWMLLGFAIRMATDLNFHRKHVAQTDNSPENLALVREIRNRERSWLICYALDRSLSAQMGKPYFISEDLITKGSGQWWKESNALPQDAGVVAYLEMQRILGRSLDLLYSGAASSGLRADCDYFLVIKAIEAQLRAWAEDWETYRQSNSQSGPSYRSSILDFYYHYAILVINLFGLQDAVENSGADLAHFFSRCYSSAMGCVLVVRNELAPGGYMRYSPDSHFVATSYAVLTLLKLMQPKFSDLHEDEQNPLEAAGDIANILEQVAANPYHTPALYGCFLRTLIASMTQPPPTSSLPQPGDPSQEYGLPEIQSLQEGVPVESYEEPRGDPAGPAPLYPPGGNTFPSADFFNNESASHINEPFSLQPPDQMTMDNTEEFWSVGDVIPNEVWNSMLLPGYGDQLSVLIEGAMQEMSGDSM